MRHRNTYEDAERTLILKEANLTFDIYTDIDHDASYFGFIDNHLFSD